MLSVPPDIAAPTATEAARFAGLLGGREDVYACGGDRCRPVRDPLTPAIWQRHLTGEAPIGVYPLRPDDTVLWGCIDADEPNFPLGAEIAELLPAPAFLERSLSGNVHLWVLFDRPCPAWAAQAVLRLVCGAVGRPELECNPKQPHVDVARGGIGNMVRLPYAGGTRPIVWKTGDPHTFDTPYTLGAFLSAAEAARADVGEWMTFAERAGLQSSAEARRGETDWGDGPLHGCLPYLLENLPDNPPGEGSRNRVVFAAARMAFHARDLDESEAREVVEAVAESCAPPLPAGEVEAIIRSVERGQYTSPGCEDIAEYADPECRFVGGV